MYYIQYHPLPNIVYRAGTSLVSSCSSHCFNLIPRLLTLPGTFPLAVFRASQLTLHAVLTVFVVDIMFTCCKAVITMNRFRPTLFFLNHVEWTRCKENLNDRRWPQKLYPSVQLLSPPWGSTDAVRFMTVHSVTCSHKSARTLCIISDTLVSSSMTRPLGQPWTLAGSSVYLHIVRTERFYYIEYKECTLCATFKFKVITEISTIQIAPIQLS